MEEMLDFCRVKKIDEKGFGFLKSLYFPGDVFFHFSQIKKEDFLEKLQEMKRGEFFLFYTVKLQPNGKMKAHKIWYSLEQAPNEYYPAFVKRIIIEFNEGRTNLFDLLFIFGELKKLNLLSPEDVAQILKSKKVLFLPSTILDYLTKSEFEEFKQILKIEEYTNSVDKPSWFEDIINYLPKE